MRSGDDIKIEALYSNILEEAEIKKNKLQLNEKVLVEMPGTIEDLVEGYYKIISALKDFVKQNPDYINNESALKGTELYQELVELTQDDMFQRLVGCGVETYMYGDANSALEDLLQSEK